MMRRRRPLLILTGVAALLIEAYVLFYDQHGTPDTRVWRPTWVGEVAGSNVFSQTLMVDAVGWHELAFRARPYGAQVQGEAVLELIDATAGANRLIFRRVLPASEVVRSRWYRLQFPPIDDARGRVFRLDVRLPGTPAGSGLALATTRDNDYRRGSLFVDGRERWPDLIFTTRATRATMFGNLQRLWSDQPGVAGPALFGLVLMLYNLALGTFVWTAWRGDVG